MPMINVNLSTIKSRELIPAGWYEAEVTSIGLTEKSGDGSYLTVSVELEDPVVTLRRNMFLSERAAPYMRLFLLACGVTDKAMTDPTFAFDTDELVGSKLRVNVIQKPGANDGIMYNDIKAFAPLNGVVQPTGPGFTL